MSAKRFFVFFSRSRSVLWIEFGGCAYRLHISGRLSDSDGAPLDGQYDLQLALYPTPTGGTTAPTYGAGNVTVENGYFTVHPDYGGNTFDGTEWYMETRVRPYGETTYEILSPRQRIVSVPYALQARSVAGNAIASAQIQDGTISFADIGQNGAGGGQVMKWSGTAWVPADDEAGTGGGVADHGALDGLGDDDHPQYLRSDSADVFNDAGSALDLRFEGSSDPFLLFLDGSQDAVGIGVASPAAKLHVVGGPVRIGNAGTPSLASGDGDLFVEDGLEVEGMSRIEDELTIGDGADGDDAIEYLKIDAKSAAWYVGVENEVAAADSGFSIGTEFSDDDTFRIDQDGDVRIGCTSSGNNRLKVVNNASSSGGATCWLENDHATGMALATDTSSSVANTVLAQYGSGSFLECFSGTEFPIRLKKDGTVECKVLTVTGGADLAEPFPTASGQHFEPGMVLAIDADMPGALRLADDPYDRAVAGVVSGAGGVNTGVMLQQEGTAAAGDCPVALSGRVYVRADANHGAIHPGDMLTSSATPGHAMKVSDYDRAHGAVLGKAMTSLESGRGLVLVLVSLH